MARYRRGPSVTDLRQKAGNAEVSIEPASETTEDAPQLTDSDIAPEASPAESKSEGNRKPRRSRKAKS